MATWPTLALWVHLSSSASDPADPATSGNWSNVGAYLRGGTTQRGVSRFDGPTIRYESATSALNLSNQDARFDPTNLSGPYVAGGVTQVQPARQYALQATWNSVRYYLFRGFADSWTPTYPLNGEDSITILRGADPMAIYARIDLQSFTPSTPGEVSSGQRIGEWAARADGFAFHGAITTGGVMLQDPTTLSGNILAGMLAATDTEIGELYFDGNASFKYRLRNDILTESRSTTSQATFQTGTSRPFESVTLSYDIQPLKNYIAATRTGGTTQVVSDAASMTAYFKRTLTRSDLMHRTDAESLDYAGYLLALLKNPELRVDSISIDPQASPTDLWPQVLGRELGDRITVAFTPVGGSAISRACYIRGIQHSFTGSSWRTTWTLQDATHYDAFFIFDDATKGKLDTGRLGY